MLKNLPSGKINKKCFYSFASTNSQKQPSRGNFKKKCSESMQQIYRRKSMPKYDFNMKLHFGMGFLL